MPINSDNPTTLPPQPAKTFDRWWFTRFAIDAPDVNGEAAVSVHWVKYRRDEQSGTGEVLPDSGRLWGKTGVLQLAATDPKVGQLFALLQQVLEEQAKADGVID